MSIRIHAELLAWHFIYDDCKLRDGRALVVGKWLHHDGALLMCESGLHASVRAIDALLYTPGSVITLCEIGGEIIKETDKLVASARRPLFAVNIEQELMELARCCALSVIHLWDAPAIVREYLETGDEAIRTAAWTAARDASWAAARDASWDAARAAAGAAARAAAGAAARAAAGAAARAAAWDAAGAAAGAAAWRAAGDAAMDAAGDAAWRAAWAAAMDAAGEAAWRAAWAAEREKQNIVLESLILDAAISAGVWAP